MSTPAEKEAILKRIADLNIKLPGGQTGITFEYYLDRPNQDVHHNDVVPWIEGMCHKRLGTDCKDPDRAIRKLHDMGLLIKVSKGTYRFEPDAVEAHVLDDFDEAMKSEVKKRDGYRCVVCGLGVQDGVELQVDHITPRSKGGKAELENAQTLWDVIQENVVQNKNHIEIQSIYSNFLEKYYRGSILVDKYSR
jgi:hypothetical protein